MKKKEAILVSAFTGFLLTKDFSDAELLKAKEDLKKDSNYYVRRF